MKTIVAAIDFSPLSDAVVSHAASMASGNSAAVLLVHAAAPDPDFVGYEVGPQYIREARAGELRHEHSELHRRAESLRAQGLEARALLVEGPTVATILAVAEDQNADLLVVGSHGHGALARVFLGSVSTDIVHHSKIPVLVVPMPGRGADD
ncbi:MAG: universal stress protein [Gammaproteobacteria bacterium]|jgi:nucleotide-binding universal stress UspA family protein